MGAHVTVAPLGNEFTVHVGLAAALGPLFVHVTVPVTVLPAGAVNGKPVTVACMSACGTIVIGALLTLLPVFGSVVLLPAVVVMLSGPLAGAVNVLVHVIVAPTANGFGAGFGVQVCVAPAGKPLNAHVGALATLGPAFVHVPLTVTGCPALTLPGTVVADCMSACGTTTSGVVATLLPGTGSAVLVLAVPVTVTVPLAGATKLT